MLTVEESLVGRYFRKGIGNTIFTLSAQSIEGQGVFHWNTVRTRLITTSSRVQVSTLAIVKVAGCISELPTSLPLSSICIIPD